MDLFRGHSQAAGAHLPGEGGGGGGGGGVHTMDTQPSDTIMMLGLVISRFETTVFL